MIYDSNCESILIGLPISTDFRPICKHTYFEYKEFRKGSDDRPRDMLSSFSSFLVLFFFFFVFTWLGIIKIT